VAARYHATELLTFAAALLERAGLPGDRARVVAEVLVEGDLLGHTTHGLVLLPPYLTHLQDGGMARTGEPAVLADLGAAVTWDGKRLPGPWLVKRAIAEARDRVLSDASRPI
jgi:L-lactate dehydrogenase